MVWHWMQLVPDWNVLEGQESRHYELFGNFPYKHVIQPFEVPLEQVAHDTWQTWQFVPSEYLPSGH